MFTNSHKVTKVNLSMSDRKVWPMNENGKNVCINRLRFIESLKNTEMYPNVGPKNVLNIFPSQEI